jgi:hypothetical protein
MAINNYHRLLLFVRKSVIIASLFDVIEASLLVEKDYKKSNIPLVLIGNRK